MYECVGGQPDDASGWSARHTSETLRHIGRQVEVLMSQYSSLQLHKRAIERHLASIAAQIHEPDVVLIPRTVFLLLELRGSGGVCDHLEQIARIVHEQGYWKPHGRVQNYHRQDVYQLGKSAQSLFDDYAVLDRRVEQLQARLGDIKERRQLEAETTPQWVFEDLAATADTVQVQGEVEAIIELLEQANGPGWFRWLFLHRSRHKIRLSWP
jgi:prefoldin subunit 5